MERSSTEKSHFFAQRPGWRHMFCVVLYFNCILLFITYCYNFINLFLV